MYKYLYLQYLFMDTKLRYSLVPCLTSQWFTQFNNKFVPIVISQSFVNKKQIPQGSGQLLAYRILQWDDDVVFEFISSVLIKRLTFLTVKHDLKHELPFKLVKGNTTFQVKSNQWHNVYDFKSKLFKVVDIIIPNGYVDVVAA